MAKNPAVMPVISELDFWFQAHTEMPIPAMMFMGNSMINSAEAIPRATPRSVTRNLLEGFSPVVSFTLTTTASRKPMAANVITGVGR